MLSLLKSGGNKVPLDRVPARALALSAAAVVGTAIGVTAANAIVDCLGTPVTKNERGWLDEIGDASLNNDPRLAASSRSTLRRIFGK